MKKIAALALALIMLLASLSALAEAASASTMVLTDLAVSYVENGKARTVKLRNMTLTLALGSADGVPSLQASFDNGKGQQVDGVMQIVGSELLISVGGISGTYYVDLEEVSSTEGGGEMMAKAIGGALVLAGPHLDVLLYALTTEDSAGMRTLELNLPGDMFVPTAEAVLSILEGIDGAEDVDVDDLRERVEGMDGDAKLTIRYRQSTGEFQMAAIQDRRGMQLSAHMELVVQPMEFVNISADEEKYNLLHLDDARLDELRGEIEIIATKFGHFAGGTGLSRILKGGK